MPRALTWLDVFTDRPLTGNGLAVVHDADGVSDDAMLAFARETRLSETTFVQSATESAADYRNRIWMTQGELPFAGHPSLGTAVAVARARGERSVTYTQQTGVGLQPIEVEAGARVARASMLQEPASFGAEVETERALRALGLDAHDAAPELPPQIVGTGLAQLVVPVRAAAALDRVDPDAAALRAVLEGPGCVCAYAAFLDPDRESASARSFFVEGSAVLEDPATGSAAGPLMAYANARTGAARLTIAQGVAMGRPSRLLCEAGERVRVAGDAVLVFQATVDL
jgi:trans-2,3-dihydro-3-hydroxyanthranilate isomerase